MTVDPVSRRALGRLALGVLTLAGLAGCGGDDVAPPATYLPLTYDYLPKLRLNVASIAIDDSWTPNPASGQHVEYLSPVQPVDALRRMARDRLLPGGGAGQARFVIEDASIVLGPGRLDGSLAVRLDIGTSGGSQSGYAEARVVRSLTGGPGDADGGRGAAYRLTKQMMVDMNVELEYQIRRSLRDYLQATDAVAPAPGPVQSQDLAPPPGVRAAPSDLTPPDLRQGL